MAKKASNIESLPACGDKGAIKAIVETPQGSRNKYSYDPETGLFECNAALSGGMAFPFEFGFIPSTLAEDGDPLDVIILMDEPSFPGCLVKVRVIGVMQAQQTEDGQTFRNDRLIAVHMKSVDYGEYENWADLPKAFVEEIEMFFCNYNDAKGKGFEILGWHGPRHALKLLDKAMKQKDSNPKKKSA
jgi:inorganic pyrophosphatase